MPLQFSHPSNTLLMKACEELDREDELITAGTDYLSNEEEGWVGGKVSFAGTIQFNIKDAIYVQLRMM